MTADELSQTAAWTAIKNVLAQPVRDRRALFLAVRNASSGCRSPMPPVRELLAAYRAIITDQPELASAQLETWLTKSTVRSLSGVAVVTVLTKPYPCPGQCIYCPTERNMPKSYLANEPAAARALACDFDPFEQVSRRLRALTENGHPSDKIELIVKGGTWSSYPWDYQQEFIRRCFDACNNFARQPDAAKIESTDLATAQQVNETADYRVIGLTLETRPDRITPAEIVRLRILGCTRIELGVQTIDDRKLELIRRGHDTSAVIVATQLLKDAGYKTDYHLMPQLPGATPETDLAELKELFDNPNFRPDMLKIYPCTVIESAELYDWWRTGRYTPYPDEDLKQVIIQAKTHVPRYCRLSRIIRDIPSPDIKAGNAVTSLRQDIQREMLTRGLNCQCLRCREVGRHQELLTAEPVFFDDVYEASGGLEHFLSIEDADRRAVFAFCRLRLPNLASAPSVELQALLPEIKHCAFVRELHTYGHLVPIDTNDPTAAQHRGHGKRLMAEAERLASQAGYRKLAVISGIGVRGYYHKLGYDLVGTYMIKTLE
ncbi:MAG: tRNA uridine(34) 5-carboxymethylaminomethyl modification radical SAM/GNAT enzyme Elp3 [Patescibacteria group bacterium]